MADQLELVNQALAVAGTRTQLTAVDTSTSEGSYAGLFYNPIRDFMLREGDYDWALAYVVPTISGVVPNPWTYQYSYPPTALRIRQVIPAVYDPLDPQPIAWNVITTGPGAGASHFIITKEQLQGVVFTYAPHENFWDAIFREAFVRYLASCLIFALENRIEATREQMNAALEFAGLANMRDS
jgi:hypothetical protein